MTDGDPEVISQLVHRQRARGASAASLSSLLTGRQLSGTARYALVLALREHRREDLPVSLHRAASDLLVAGTVTIPARRSPHGQATR